MFDKTTLDRANNRVTAESFDAGQLRRCDFSIFRRRHIIDAEVMLHVGIPNAPKKGALVGISCALCRTIRDIRHGTTQIFCVVDKVEDGDFDAHAALGFSGEFIAAIDAMSQVNRSKEKAKVLAAIAMKFGSVEALKP